MAIAFWSFVLFVALGASEVLITPDSNNPIWGPHLYYKDITIASGERLRFALRADSDIMYWFDSETSMKQTRCVTDAYTRCDFKNSSCPATQYASGEVEVTQHETSYATVDIQMNPGVYYFASSTHNGEFCKQNQQKFQVTVRDTGYVYEIPEWEVAGTEQTLKYDQEKNAGVWVEAWYPHFMVNTGEEIVVHNENTTDFPMLVTSNLEAGHHCSFSNAKDWTMVRDGRWTAPKTPGAMYMFTCNQGDFCDQGMHFSVTVRSKFDSSLIEAQKFATKRQKQINRDRNTVFAAGGDDLIREERTSLWGTDKLKYEIPDVTDFVPPPPPPRPHGFSDDDGEDPNAKVDPSIVPPEMKELADAIAAEKTRESLPTDGVGVILHPETSNDVGADPGTIADSNSQLPHLHVKEQNPVAVITHKQPPHPEEKEETAEEYAHRVHGVTVDPTPISKEEQEAMAHHENAHYQGHHVPSSTISPPPPAPALKTEEEDEDADEDKPDLQLDTSVVDPKSSDQEADALVNELLSDDDE